MVNFCKSLCSMHKPASYRVITTIEQAKGNSEHKSKPRASQMQAKANSEGFRKQHSQHIHFNIQYSRSAPFG